MNYWAWLRFWRRLALASIASFGYGYGAMTHHWPKSLTVTIGCAVVLLDMLASAYSDRRRR